MASITAVSPVPKRGFPSVTPIFRHRGFTLTELAIVMFIVALMISGMLMPLSAQQEIRARGETEKMLNDIREALNGYAMIKGYLPCPAPVDLSTNGAEATRDPSTGVCPIRVGLLPSASLGLGLKDSWGHFFRYSVTPAFSTSSPTNMISITSVGDITVRTRDSAGTLQTLAAAVPAVVVSHGALHAWAYNDTGIQMADSANINTDEDTNGNDAAGTSFVSRTPAPRGAADPGEFDDIVVWLSTNTLISRMVSAGKL